MKKSLPNIWIFQKLFIYLYRERETITNVDKTKDFLEDTKGERQQ